MFFFRLCLYLFNSLYLFCHVHSAQLSLQLFTSCVSVLHDTVSVTEWQFTKGFVLLFGQKMAIIKLLFELWEIAINIVDKV